MSKKSKKGRFLIGECGVDSGQIMIIDPCYVKHCKELTDPSLWNKMCGIFEENDWNPFEYRNGVISGNHIGDGGYPVYATFNEDGAVTKLEILFHYTNNADESRMVDYEEQKHG